MMPIDKDGKQAWNVNPPLHIRVQLWIHEYLYLPLLGEVHRHETFENMNIMGENKLYVYCTFKRCSFNMLNKSVIKNCIIYVEGTVLHLGHITKTSIKNCRIYLNHNG